MPVCTLLANTLCNSALSAWTYRGDLHAADNPASDIAGARNTGRLPNVLLKTLIESSLMHSCFGGKRRVLSSKLQLALDTSLPN